MTLRGVAYRVDLIIRIRFHPSPVKMSDENQPRDYPTYYTKRSVVIPTRIHRLPGHPHGATATPVPGLLMNHAFLPLQLKDMSNYSPSGVSTDVRNDTAEGEISNFTPDQHEQFIWDKNNGQTDKTSIECLKGAFGHKENSYYRETDT